MNPWKPPVVRALACPECKLPFQPRGAGHSPACSIGRRYQAPERVPGWTFLAFGSRGLPPGTHPRVWAFLDDVLAKHPDMVLLHGGAQGLDYTAGSWAKKQGVAEEVWRPQYDLFGKWLSPLWRNGEMAARKPEAGVGFIGPCEAKKCPFGYPHGSHGSVDMAVRALALGVPVFPHVWGGLDELANWMTSGRADESGKYRPKGDGT